MFAKATPDNHLEPETDLLPGFETTLSVGEILRRSRVKAGYSLEQVEQGVCIRASQIQAMEDGRWESLPGRVYVFGFIRTYSEYLGLDGEKMVLLLKQQSGKHVAPKPLVIAVEEEDLPLPDRLGDVIASVLPDHVERLGELQEHPLKESHVLIHRGAEQILR